MISSTTLAAAAKVAERAARISTPSLSAGQASFPQQDSPLPAMDREAPELAPSGTTFSSPGAPAPNDQVASLSGSSRSYSRLTTA